MNKGFTTQDNKHISVRVCSYCPRGKKVKKACVYRKVKIGHWLIPHWICYRCLVTEQYKRRWW